jgi:biotin carboxyl carrier protein
MSKKVTVIVEGREYVVEVGDLSETPVRATVNNKTYQVDVPERSQQFSKSADAPAQPKVSASSAKTKSPVSVPAGGSVISAPLPGDIIEVRVKPGDSVDAGDVVCVLEAMKMKNMIRSGHQGVIASVEVSPGQAVDHGEVLVSFE